MYNLILYGDPSMHVWTDVPKSYDVILPQELAPGKEAKFKVYEKTDAVSEKTRPAVGANVTFLGGWKGSTVKPPIYETSITNEKGEVSWTPPNEFGSSIKGITITITKGNFWPYVAKYFTETKEWVSPNYDLHKTGNIAGITGTVIDSGDGTLIESAIVSSGEIKTITDSQGNYTLIGVPSGSKHIRASAEGYNPIIKSVEVIGGQTITVNFRVKPKPPCWGAKPNQETCTGSQAK